MASPPGSQIAPRFAPATVESVAGDGDVDVANNYDVATADGSLKVTNRDAKYEVTGPILDRHNVWLTAPRSPPRPGPIISVIDAEYAVSGYGIDDPASRSCRDMSTPTTSPRLQGQRDPAGNDDRRVRHSHRGSRA